MVADQVVDSCRRELGYRVGVDFSQRPVAGGQPVFRMDLIPAEAAAAAARAKP